MKQSASVSPGFLRLALSWEARRSSFLSLLPSDNLPSKGLGHKTTDLSVQPRDVSPFGLGGTLAGAEWEPRPQGLGDRVYVPRRCPRGKIMCYIFLLKQRDREGKNWRAKPMFSSSCLNSANVIPLGMFKGHSETKVLFGAGCT